MDLRKHYLRKINISTVVQQEAENLITQMRENTMSMDVLPNSYENYTGRIEVDDYLSFCRFLESRRGKIILEMMEDNI